MNKKKIKHVSQENFETTRLLHTSLSCTFKQHSLKFLHFMLFIVMCTNPFWNVIALYDHIILQSPSSSYHSGVHSVMKNYEGKLHSSKLHKNILHHK